MHEQLSKLTKEQEDTTARCSEVKAKTVACLKEKVRLHEEEEENMRTMEAAEKEVQELRRTLEAQKKKRDVLDDELLAQRQKIEGAMQGNEGKRAELKKLEHELQMENLVLEEHKAVCVFVCLCVFVCACVLRNILEYIAYLCALAFLNKRNMQALMCVVRMQKLQEEIAKRKQQEDAFKREMARLKSERVDIESNQNKLHEEVTAPCNASCSLI